MPKEFNLFAEDILHGGIGDIVAIGAGKCNDANLHEGFSTS
jgi:hypothetical protein